MITLTPEYIAEIKKRVPDWQKIVIVRCREHQFSPVEAFYDLENGNLVLSCWQCEKPLLSQPMPKETKT